MSNSNLTFFALISFKLAYQIRVTSLTGGRRGSNNYDRECDKWWGVLNYISQL